jgi:phospholipid/cholesterol/gamma-HCH transport system ATP-binding protein
MTIAEPRAHQSEVLGNDADGTEPAVRLDHVTKAFGELRVLDDVSFDVPEGIGFIILGRSGTGKSVALRHIIGLLRPDQGRVFVRGREISALSGEALSEVRREIGFLFQNAALFDSISVGENVAFPMRRHTRMSDREIRERAMAKLESVGLGRDYEKMPGDLSGGMRKRAGLARAMALDPAILLVDEPSAGLDPVTSEEIDQLLITLREEGTTLIVVTHNIPSARALGDRLVMLHEGRIVAEGTVADFERSEHELVRAFMSSSHSG